jgi:hypothetical protein
LVFKVVLGVNGDVVFEDVDGVFGLLVRSRPCKEQRFKSRTPMWKASANAKNTSHAAYHESRDEQRKKQADEPL